jgi:hypothetical protein
VLAKARALMAATTVTVTARRPRRSLAAEHVKLKLSSAPPLTLLINPRQRARD